MCEPPEVQQPPWPESAGRAGLYSIVACQAARCNAPGSAAAGAGFFSAPVLHFATTFALAIIAPLLDDGVQPSLPPGLLMILLLTFGLLGVAMVRFPLRILRALLPLPVPFRCPLLLLPMLDFDALLHFLLLLRCDLKHAIHPHRSSFAAVHLSAMNSVLFD
jgi:hypothetical protein